MRRKLGLHAPKVAGGFTALAMLAAMAMAVGNTSARWAEDTLLDLPVVGVAFGPDDQVTINYEYLTMMWDQSPDYENLYGGGSLDRTSETFKFSDGPEGSWAMPEDDYTFWGWYCTDAFQDYWGENGDPDYMWSGGGEWVDEPYENEGEDHKVIPESDDGVFTCDLGDGHPITYVAVFQIERTDTITYDAVWLDVVGVAEETEFVASEWVTPDEEFVQFTPVKGSEANVADDEYFFVGWYHNSDLIVVDDELLLDPLAERLDDCVSALPCLFQPEHQAGHYIAVFQKSKLVTLEFSARDTDGTELADSPGCTWLDSVSERLAPDASEAVGSWATPCAGYEFAGWYHIEQFDGSGQLKAGELSIADTEGTEGNVTCDDESGLECTSWHLDPVRDSEGLYENDHDIALFRMLAEPDTFEVTYSSLSITATSTIPACEERMPDIGGSVSPSGLQNEQTGSVAGSTAWVKGANTFLGWYLDNDADGVCLGGGEDDEPSPISTNIHFTPSVEGHYVAVFRQELAGITVSKTAWLDWGLPTAKPLGTLSGVDVGDNVTFVFTVTNSGTLPVTNVSVSDSLVDAKGNAIGSVAVVNCAQSSLDAGASTTCTTSPWTPTLNDEGAWHRNQGSASASLSDGSLHATSNTVSLQVNALNRNVSIVKTAVSVQTGDEQPRDIPESGSVSVNVGDVVKFEYLIKNTGAGPLTNVEITDQVNNPVPGGQPTLLKNFGPDASIDCPSFDGTLAVGATVICNATWPITNDEAHSGWHSNAAMVTADGAQAESAMSLGVTLKVNPPEIAFAKAAVPTLGGAITTGTEVDFHYLVTNLGASPLSWESLTDDQHLDLNGLPVQIDTCERWQGDIKDGESDGEFNTLNDKLDTNQSVRCTKTLVITEDQVTNLSVVTEGNTTTIVGIYVNTATIVMTDDYDQTVRMTSSDFWMNTKVEYAPQPPPPPLCMGHLTPAWVVTIPKNGIGCANPADAVDPTTGLCENSNPKTPIVFNSTDYQASYSTSWPQNPWIFVGDGPWVARVVANAPGAVYTDYECEGAIDLPENLGVTPTCGDFLETNKNTIPAGNSGNYTATLAGNGGSAVWTLTWTINISSSWKLGDQSAVLQITLPSGWIGIGTNTSQGYYALNITLDGKAMTRTGNDFTAEIGQSGIDPGETFTLSAVLTIEAHGNGVAVLGTSFMLAKLWVQNEDPNQSWEAAGATTTPLIKGSSGSGCAVDVPQLFNASQTGFGCSSSAGCPSATNPLEWNPAPPCWWEGGICLAMAPLSAPLAAMDCPLAVDTLEFDRLAVPFGFKTPNELELIGDWQPLEGGANAAAFTFGQYGTWSGFGSVDGGEWIGLEPVVSTSAAPSSIGGTTTGSGSTTGSVVSTGSTTGVEWLGSWTLDEEGNFRAYSDTPLPAEPELDESPWCPVEEPLTGSWLLDARYLGIGECTRSERRRIGASTDDECETLAFFGTG
ncbi:MAG: hypothetical protein FWG25_03445, partial [Promicromonosporaceae bacterium]|nr:hypothetical protein [Promicromonosporaceae bacterium]